MGVKGRLRLIVVVAAVGLIALCAFWLLEERSILLAARKDEAQHLVAVPYSALNELHQLELEGKIDRGEAQKQALETLRSFRYGEDNYFWVMDMHPTMLMHPIKPELNGQDLSQFKDPDGKTLFAEMVQSAAKNGGGFVSYRWPKPGAEADGAVPKLSYVQRFQPWDWVIGTGIYIDDLDAAWINAAPSAIGLGVGCLVALTLVSTSFSRSILRRLDWLVLQMKAVAGGKANYHQELMGMHLLPSGGNDEIHVLVTGFREMMAQIEQRDSQLCLHQQVLENKVAERTAEWAAANAEIELFLECIPSILIGLDSTGRITHWNQAASSTFGLVNKNVQGLPFEQCGIKWVQTDMKAELAKWLATDSFHRCDDLAFQRDDAVRYAGLGVRPIISKENQNLGLIITGTDITERKSMEDQLRQANKLEAIGQLSAGVAHEINTPMQFVSDNTCFLKESCAPVLKLLEFCKKLQEESVVKGTISPESLWEFDHLAEACDYQYLSKEIPVALEQSIEGLQRVGRIVHAMKEFAHPGSGEKEAVDLNHIIEATVTVARGEWKHVADVKLDLAPDLPSVIASSDEVKQVLLNLLVNAAHAIRDIVGDGGQKGNITITSRWKENCAEISIADTGSGIAEQHQAHVFEPFFTTKPVGSGTGQGLALAHNIVVKRHHGRIWFESKIGAGTTFFIRLPQHAEAAATH